MHNKYIRNNAESIFLNPQSEICKATLNTSESSDLDPSK